MRLPAACLLGTLFAACAASPRHASTWRIVSALPVPVAAALVAEAVATTLPTADPEPHRPGAPVRRDGDGYRLDLVDVDGTLLLAGDCRVWILPPTHRRTDAELGTVAAAYRDGGAVLGSVRIRQIGPGVEIAGTLPPSLAGRIETACRDAIATASDSTLRGGGGWPDSLSAYLATRLLAEARAGDPTNAADLLRQAIALGADWADLHLRAAERERAIGRAVAARRSELLAVLSATDAHDRAVAARGCCGNLDAVGLRALADRAVARGDEPTAAALLHSARRLQEHGDRPSPEIPSWGPAVLAELDGEMARAAWLLARERAEDRRRAQGEVGVQVAAPPR